VCRFAQACDGEFSSVPDDGAHADEQHLPMIALSIALGLAIMAAFATRRPSRHRGADQDLGFVSHRWLDEYRLSHISEPDR
jgi:hypothetical protein